MKNISIRTLAFATVTAIAGLATTTPVTADPSFTIHIGNQGPPRDREDYQQWQSPHQSAVWIPGHNEWQDGHYVWIGGYYGYPPRRHSHWVAPRYPHNQDGYSYRPGHWSN